MHTEGRTFVDLVSNSVTVSRMQRKLGRVSGLKHIVIGLVDWTVSLELPPSGELKIHTPHFKRRLKFSIYLP